jgi:CSLREA domain-containing protein
MPRSNRYASPNQGTRPSTNRSLRSGFLNRLSTRLSSLRGSGKRRLGVFVAALCVCALTGATWLYVRARAATPVPMATTLVYLETFTDMAAWGSNFSAGIGANRYVNITAGVFPAPTHTTVFTSGGTGGVQKGTGTIVLLPVGTTNNTSASAFDLTLDFTGVNAGTVSLDWAEVDNGFGPGDNRVTVFKLQTNTGGGGTFVDLPGSTVTVTNGVASSGSLTNVALPSGFNSSAGALLRFYAFNGTGGTAGSRPKISIDNVSVTVGAASLQYRSKATGLWSAASTWEVSTDGTTWVDAVSTPTASNGAITVRSPHIVTVSTAVAADELTVNTGGILLINGVTLTIPDNAGTDLTINGIVGAGGSLQNGGQVQVNGTLRLDDGGFADLGSGTYMYDQTTGTLAFNKTTTATVDNTSDHWPTTNGPQNVSVASGGITINSPRTIDASFQTSGGVSTANNLTLNGSFTLFDGGSVTGAPTYGPASTLIYIKPSNFTAGAEWGTGTSGPGVPNNVTILSGIGTVGMGAGTKTILGNMTITSGTFSMGAGDLNVKGNWSNSGSFNPVNNTVKFNGAGAQSIFKLGGETFYDLEVNKASGGLTLTSPVNVDGLALVAGNVTTTAANLLTVNGTAASRLFGGSASSYINGPLARRLPASLATGTTYLFPVGKAGFNKFELVNPTTNAGGTVTLMAEEFDGNAGGTPGTGMTSLNTNRYWNGSITSGSGNFTNTSVRLADSTVTATDVIAKSATQGGAYASIGGTAVAGSTVLSNPFSSFSFFVIGAPVAACIPPSTVYVDDSWVGTTPGDDPDGVGSAVNFGCDSFATIQGGIDGVTPGGTVFVATGDYFENPTVNKAVSLQGANAGTSGSAARVAESNVRTLGASQTAVFTVTSNNVTIDGFQIDGDDPGQAGAPLTSGENTNVSYGVRPTGAFNNVTVRNNIIRRVAIGFRGDGASQNNTVTANWFDSVGFYDFGYAVSLRGNYYANITNNKMTRAWTGVHLNNHNGAGGPASFTISGNEIHSYAGGILYWLQFNGATGATISNNTITAEPTAVANNFGILVVSNQDAISSTFTSNAISGHNYGIGLFNVPTTNNITIGATNSISGASLAGVLLTDNLNFNPVGTTNFLAGGPGATSTVNLTGLSITGNTGRGIKVEGGTNVQTLNATGVNVTGTSGTRGMEFVGGFATANVTSSTFTGFATGIALLDTSSQTVTANFNRIISATTAIDNPNNQTPNLQNNWWGCNLGPNNAGCGAVNGVNANFNPWIVLLGSASPNPITPGAMSTVSADMTKNSTSGTPVGTLPNIPVGYMATNGTLDSPTGTIIAGADTADFTSTSSDNAVVTISVDSQNVPVSITVTAPTFSIGDVTQAEGNSGTTLFTFTITKNGTTGLSSSVDYATADGSAVSTGGSPDFTAISATPVTFTSGETTKQFSVSVNGDTMVEPNEAFTVNLTNASGATISDATATGTITNDDNCAVFTTVYVDDNWVGTTPGTDPDAGGPATSFGCDSFATIQNGVNGASAGGTVQVAAGTYDEDVAITNAGLQLIGAGAGTTNIRGAIGGAGATVQLFSSNNTVAGFTITRLGNNTADWNDANGTLNLTGIAIQGQAVTGALIRDNIITGNRSGIDINNSNGHTVRNNVIDFNRTGFIFRNQTEYMTVVENFITNNWTAGVLFLDASSPAGSNVPLQSALHSNFSNNNISANWYAQIVDRQTGGAGAIPPPGTTNLKNFRGNWFGTTSPVVTTANSAEPGYAAQIPVAYGGTATPPGGQPDIAGPASANFQYTPFLRSGTDTNVETTPGRGTNGFQGVANNITVQPANQNGWIFFDDFGSGAGTGGFEPGPGTAPLGEGSAYLQVDAVARHALATAGYGGTRMDEITDLRYSSYQNTLDPNYAISLQFDIDYDQNDAANAYAGRLVFEPYLSPAQGAVQQNVWQPWNALAGKWYGTRTTVTVNNVAGVAQPCQPASPCTWAQVLASFPNAGVRVNALSAILFKAGGPWAPNFDGNVDAFQIGINGANITYDFEPAPGLSINDVTLAEGNAGQTAYNFTVTLSRVFDQVVTVDVATTDDTATSPSDFTAVPVAQLTFNPGETTKPVVVQVNGDTDFESTEQFFVSLTNASANATIRDAQGVGTITNDEAQFSIDDVTLAEGNAGQTAFTFTVTKSGANGFPTSVAFTTADGTAKLANNDYVLNSGTLNFGPSDTSLPITVQVNGDTTPELNETFFVNLSLPSGASIGDAQGLGTINNDDACGAFSTVYVDDSWAGSTLGDDPDAGGPATIFGCDSFATIQEGVNAVSSGGTVQVAAGTYDEDVAITNAGLQLIGAGAGVTNIRGPFGGPGATVQLFSSNNTVAGFTITRLGNNTTDWNNATLNSTGIAIQGQSITGAVIRDNIITGNRSGLDINNSNGHTVRNNVVDFNRTGFIFRNQTDNMTVVENFITNNWTVGVLFLDASGGTNSPVQTAAYSTFSNNNISANWYGQIVDRQAGGSLPAGGTNLKNFRGNWFGTTSPVVTTANSAEPGYAAQIPVAYGGTATAPGGQPDIAGGGSANFKYTPFLQSGTDTNVETTPGRGTFGFQGVATNVTVTPSNLNGWVFFDDSPGTGTGNGGFEPGPGTPPLGEGSAFLQVDGLGRHALGTGGFGGTRMDHVTDLSYRSYQNTLDPSFAISLQFDIDYDLNDAATAYAGRLVFEPYLSPAQGAIQQNVWQPWNALAGKWYGTRTTVTVNNGAGVTQPCQPATPCTWTQVLALFPNAGVRNTPTSLVLFKAGGPWAPNFDGNIDAFLFGINASDITYDFEPLPGLSINDVTLAEGDAGQTAFNFTVTLSRVFDQIVTVDVVSADNSATSPSDFTALPLTQVTFNPGETTKPVVVQVNGDTVPELNEQFFVNLSNVSANAEIRDPQGIGTINNDEVAFSIDDVTLAEGNGGQTAFIFTVTKAGATAIATSVQFATANGTATTANNDYAANSGTLNFGPADTSLQVTVQVNGDVIPEPNETFFVNLSNPSGATIADAQGLGTINSDDGPPPVVYVDDGWTGVTPGDDPDGGGPATSFGFDAFATVQGGVNGVAPGGIVNVYDGTYLEDVTISSNGTRLLGFGPGVKTISGAIGGPSAATITVAASNVTIAAFTITRQGNNTTDWNNAGLNSTGISIQGLSLSGTLIRDNVLTGNRTGIDVNNSNNHTIRNNTIDNNRTGMIFRNQTEGFTVVENFVTNNWTVGILFLDASGGTNSPVQSAVGSVFNNNDLSGNWYGQVVDRQTGGSLPAPNTTNLKNFRGNWFGNTSPIVTTANSVEPGYAAQIPVIYGGSSTAPGGQPDIAGPASANIKYIPFLQSGTDTNVETVAGRGTNGFQGIPSADIVIRETNLKGWTQQHSTCGAAGTGSQAFVVGPGTPPLGEGSLQFSIGANGDSFETIRSVDYNNTRLDMISGLSYSTYVVQDGSGGQAPYLLLNIDYTGDNVQDDQIFFEPVYQHAHTVNVPDQGALVVGTWQSWNAQAGGWWSVNNIAGAGPGADVKTLAQYLAVQPNARILHPASGQGGFRIATGCGAGAWDNFIGNVDKLIVSLSAANTRYDFEPLPRISIDDVSHAEGQSGTTDYTFTISMSAASDQTVTVDYATGNVSATEPSDYTALTTTQLIFNPGETSKQVTVTVNGDMTVEPDETFTLNLSNAVNATIADASGTGTIINDDTDVSVAVSPSAVAEDGAANLVYTFTRTGVTTGSVTANYSVSGTAAANDYTYIPGGSDTFTPPTGTVTFGPTVTSVTVTIDPTADISYEADETVILTVTSGTGYNVGSPSVATGTISNDDVIPTTLVVTKTDDTNDGFCSLDDCSLREAITNANANVDASTINFNIPNADAGRNVTTGVYTITLGSDLPAISQPVTINGYSQEPCPPSPTVPCSRENTLAVGSDALLLIEINATNGGGYGLVVDASNTLLKGLVINRATQSEIWLRTGTNQAVRGSYLGTDAAGAVDFGNTARSGIEINGNNGNTIGGPNPADRNVISGGNGAGVFLINGASNNTVQNNYIGTDKSGLLELQNTGSGVIIDNRTNNTIRGNVISGNDADGIEIRGDFVGLTTPNQILGNIIGLQANGTMAMGNIGAGVHLHTGATNQIIGGILPGEANIIAFNGGDGVWIESGVGTTIRGNSIFTNGTFANGALHLGIDLGADGVTANDDDDPDTGANNLQNFPTISAAQTGSPNTIRGTLSSTPSQTFTIDIYSSSACDASGNGEGAKYLGSTTTTTGANGDAFWSINPATLAPGDVITATATDSSGNTSEFSPCFAAVAFSPGEIKFAFANTDDTETNSGTHTANIVVQRVNGSDRTVTVGYTISDGTATTADSDYSVTSTTGTLRWTNGDTADKNIAITVHGDTKFELDETVNVTLSNPLGGATISGTNPATLTIKNDDSQPTILINDVTHTEGNAGTTDYDFTVSLSNASYQTVTVNAATLDSSATTADADYVGRPSTLLTFAPDDTEEHFIVQVNGDLNIEPNEQFFVTLSTPSNATTTDQGVGTITNDDTAVSVTVAPSAAAEDGGPDLVYTFTRSPLTAGPITVNFSVGGTADFGTDYTQTGAATFNTTSGTVVIANGDTTATVTINPSTDSTVELDETVDLTVTLGTGYNVGTPTTASATITNDDTDISVAVAPAAISEDDPPDQLTNPVMVYTFTRTGVTTGAITVNFSVAGTAVFPADYTQTGASAFSASSGTVEFGDGVTTATVTIDPVTEAIYETNETVILTVVAGTGYEPFDAPNNSATGTINNNDAKPSLSIGDRIANEGTSGPATTTNFVFTVTRTGSTEVTATVDFATAPGSPNPATGGAACGGSVDYVTQTGSLTFLPNESTKPITILVCRDANVEANETFFVDLSNANEATINDGQGRGTIQNDDSPGTTLTVNTTDDLNDGTCNAVHCSLRELIIAVSGSPGADAIGINFDIPATDPRHFYYANDGVAGQVTNDVTHVLPTTATDDTTISGIDPDWPHSWWSILPASTLPAISHRVILDGYSQTGSTANALTAGNDAVLRIELSGESAGPAASGLTLQAGTSSISGIVVNRFTGHGIDLQGGTNNTVIGNRIGTDVSGTLDLGNTLNGVNNTGSSATIGGATSAEVNIISGNNGDGLSFTSTNSILVLGNLIGTKANGTSALGNGGNGISVAGAGAVFNTIGGTQAGEANTIAFNGGDGVQIAGTAGQGNAISGNSIYSNGTTANHLGIDIGADGVTANDAMDVDSGANNLQNFPVITLARVTGSTRTISGTLNSTPNSVFTIDFYQSPSCDTSGNGEGKTYVTSITTDQTDASGDVSFSFHPTPLLTIGNALTATATSTGASSSTSEFSQCVTINDGSPNAGDIQFTDATYTVGEGGGTATITVKRVGGSNGSVTTTFSTSNNSATAPSDYVAVNSFPITFVEGETANKTVTVTINEDTVYEGDETLLLSLGSTVINARQGKDDSLAAADPHAAVLTITENDAPPTLTINDVTHLEGNSGGTNYQFTVTKTGSTALGATVNYATAPGSATSPSDFTAVSGTLAFLPSETTKQVTVVVNGDTLVEPDETFAVNLSSPTEATISDGVGAGTITNDDTDVSVAVSPGSVFEDGIPNLVYTFTRTGVTTGAATVNFSVTGTAQFGADYTQTGAATFTTTSGTVTFGAGNTTATVTLDPSTDSLAEADETAILTVTSGSGYNAVAGSATGTITNDDTEVTVAVAPSSVSEDGAPNLVYTFTRTGLTAGALTVNFSVAGTAAFGTDYTQTGADTFTTTSGTVTFGAGNSTATVTVNPSTDSSAESNETVILTLASGAGYNVASPSAATGTITNDDASGGIVRFSSATYNTTENSHTVTITVERVGDTSGAATVNYATPDDSESPAVVPCATVNGSASPRCDFTTALGTLRFAAGETSKTFVVLISQDNYVEGPEALTLTLSNLTGGAVFGTPATAILSIDDDLSEPAANPIDDADNFVRQHYHDFLNREPDASGLAFWRNQITACGSNAACIEDRRIHVSAAFYLSIEFQDTGYLVERLYKTSYGDATGSSTIGSPHTLQVPIVRFSEFLLDTQEIGLGVIVGQPGWEAALENNKTAFLARYVQRARFIAEYPLSMTPEAFVDKLNANAGNPLSAAERNQLVNDLSTATKTRAQVVRAVAEDPDLAQAEFNRAFVLMQYFGYLRRNPNVAPDSDYSGYDFWLTKLNQFNGDFVKAEMVKAFLDSLEYRKRSGQ